MTAETPPDLGDLGVSSSRILAEAPAQEIGLEEHRREYLRLLADHGPEIWNAVAGKELRLRLIDKHHHVLQDSGHPAVFGTPETLCLYWDLIDRLDKHQRRLFVLGERGVGKDILSRVVADWRGKGDPVAVNCATLSEETAEAVLFGVAPDAGYRTGPKGTKGYVGEANGRVLFLDEFFDAPESVLPMLLRLLENWEWCRVGEPAPTKLSASTVIVAASNRYPTHAQLHDAVRMGQVRADVVERFDAEMVVPPLRQRRTEIGGICDAVLEHLHLAHSQSDSHRRVAPVLDSEIRTYLATWQFDWPGNVRQLRNLLSNQFRLRLDEVRTTGRLTFSPEVARRWLSSGPAERSTELLPARVLLPAWTDSADYFRRIRTEQLVHQLRYAASEAGTSEVSVEWVRVACQGLFPGSKNIYTQVTSKTGLSLGTITDLVNSGIRLSPTGVDGAAGSPGAT